MPDFRPTILIPTYNTGPILRETVKSAIATGYPVRVVVDGSDDGSDACLTEFEGLKGFTLHRLPVNQGKGAAILFGIRAAEKDGFTHALAMDADGQHPADRILDYFRVGSEHPQAAVFGSPIFDASAPALRVGGRKISNFWANLETLGWGIDDSLFGMRLYPIRELISVLEETRFARRFDFDPEVAVRLCWKGVPVINLPTAVHYPSAEDGGISQFRYLRDNILLTWMHARLMIGFFIRAPWLAFRGDNPLLHLSPSVR
ncbi:glycosyltransferase family 2 protein [Haloferula chungangensis]|uniref:Glycosyltransferase family 2 protein n=1 Tax=Haloferula chungangensis TaxID=1048331 RepID=A0ABW2L2S0_9BACT